MIPQIVFVKFNSNIAEFNTQACSEEYIARKYMDSLSSQFFSF